MTTTTSNKLTGEDHQLSEVNQLGTLLDVYRLKPGDIRFLRRISLLSCILYASKLIMRPEWMTE